MIATPWTAVPDSNDESEWYVIDTAEEVVAMGLPKDNARLIAAAPDLLAAVIEASAYCPVAIQDKCRAAIAKATGEA